VKNYLKLSIVSLVLCAGCAGLISNLPVIAQDLSNLITIVYNDVVAGKPFAQILIDTGDADGALLLAILTSMESDPKLTPDQKAAYAKLCDPYIAQAKISIAAHHVADNTRHYRVTMIGQGRGTVEVY
jgi:hypothetical protein